MQSVLITGVSSGIGYAAAKRLAGAGYRVFGSVRSEADAKRLRTEMPEAFEALQFDVTEEDTLLRAVGQLEQRLAGRGLYALINNAGISEPGPLIHQPAERLLHHFDVNVVGAHRVTAAVAPLLGATSPQCAAPGRVINISSVSGRIAYPFMGAYAASKHALEAWSDALRRELCMYGIAVVVIEPSTVQTPIVDKFMTHIERYADTDYGPILDKVLTTAKSRRAAALSVDRVTEVIERVLSSKEPSARYPIPRNLVTSWWLPRALPDKVFDRLVSRQLGMARRR